MKRYMGHLIRSAETRVEHFLAVQVKDRNRRDCGGMRSTIFEAKPTIYAMTDAAAVYLNEMSRFYQDDRLFTAMVDAMGFIEASQREDGSFDFPSCNFKSAPDTSFCFKRLIATYRLFAQYGKEARVETLKKGYFEILSRALPAILTGGFHTPNHRWGISAALLQGTNLLKETDSELAKKLRVRADQYLLEGIDGNDEGEYAERSTGNYNAVVNNAMLAMYEETRDEVYLGYVERNLKMMMYYFDPDDTIFTQNSTRQDQGKADHPDKYFYQYLYMAALTKDPVFDGAAHKLIKDNMERGDLAPECLHIIMLHDFMEQHEFQNYGFLETYHKHFKEAGVVRVKKPDFGYSIIKGKSNFLFFKCRDTLVYLKIGESYCDIRNFIPQTMEEDERGYTLKALAKGWFYLPFEEKQETTDWWEMDHGRREILNSSEVELTVRLEELENGLAVTVRAEGLDRLPLRVEVCIPAGSVIYHPQFCLRAGKGEGMILRDGYVDVMHQDVTLRLGPGYGTHEFEGHYSGEERNDTGYTIYFNDYTPYERTFFIQCFCD